MGTGMELNICGETKPHKHQPPSITSACKTYKTGINLPQVVGQNLPWLTRENEQIPRGMSTSYGLSGEVLTPEPVEDLFGLLPIPPTSTLVLPVTPHLVEPLPTPSAKRNLESNAQELSLLLCKCYSPTLSLSTYIYILYYYIYMICI